MTNYTLGFYFDKDLTRVALIRKNRPLWQMGKLNGIGGHLEDGEVSIDGHIREFFEETGVSEVNWNSFGELKSEDFCVTLFCGTGDLSLLKSKTDEKIETVPIAEVLALKDSMVDNLLWLIFLAINNINYGRPSFVTVKY